ncbi:MAG TPA: hypothetical protein VGJ18_01360 [Gemmatimonadaceae bacterium]
MSRHRTALAIIGLAVAAAGCGSDSPTGTRGALSVTLRADGPDTTFIGDEPNEGPRIQCSFDITAQATGLGSAQWVGAKTLWYIGPDRSVPVDSTTNNASELQAEFGAQGISSGETQHARWTLYASAPFEATLEFMYAIAGGATSSVNAHVRCGPPAQGAVAPVITALSVTASPPQPSVGDTISVSYQETGASGVWATAIDLSGPFTAEQVTTEHLASSVTRTVKFAVPPHSTLGVPVTVLLHAYDAALHETQKSLATQLLLVDRTPPVMIHASLSRSSQQQPGLDGQYAVGDTMTLTGIATDDNALGWLVYTLGTPANARDSVAAPGAVTYQWWDVPIVVRPEWVGSPPMTVYARDAAGLTSQSISSAAGAVRFYPRVELPATTPLKITAYDGPTDVAYDAKRDLVYVGVSGQNQIAVFAASTMTLQTPIALPAPPGEMDLSLSGDSLLVALPSQNAVAVVDLTQPAVPATLLRLSSLDTVSAGPLGPFDPDRLRIAANGKMLVMLDHSTTSKDYVIEVDLITHAQRFRTDARQPATYVDWYGDVGRTSDRSHIYLLGTCSSRYDAATDTFTSCSNGFSPIATNGISVDAAGDRIAAGRTVEDSNLGLIWAIMPDPAQPPTLLSPDGSEVYFGVGASLTLARIADQTYLERIPLPITPGRLFMAPNGKWLLAFGAKDFNTAGTHVTRVDLP